MSAVAPKLSERLNEVLGTAVRAKANVVQKVEATPTTVPTNNPFYKVMFDTSLDDEAKSAAITKLTTFPGTKEDSRALIKAYAEFQEYMQTVRETMAKEIIRLQDTDTFSILQNIMNNLNGQLLDFEKEMQPLTDITDAIYTLRTKGATLDVYKEIQDDKQREEKEKVAAEEQERQLQAVTTNASSLPMDCGCTSLSAI